MSKLLFLAHRIPYPPDKGDKIRAYQILRHLAKRHEVYLGTFVDDPNDQRYTDEVRDLCSDAYFASVGRRRLLARGASGLLRGAAITQWGYRDRGLEGWVQAVLRDIRPRSAFVFSSVMGQYVLGAAPELDRLVVDFVDVDSDKWAQYAKVARWPASALYRREAERLLAYDRSLAGAADASLFVSEEEVRLFATLAPEVSDSLRAVPNGVDAAYFDPDADIDPVAPTGRPALVFTGAMDYRPNVDAVQWFVEAILPILKPRHPELSLSIVGTSPSPKVVALGKNRNVSVTGRVPDIRSYLAAADVVVAPMRLARGIQNKVLEGMAMGRPVVTTPQGLEGLSATAGQHLLVSSGAEDFAAAIDNALNAQIAKSLGSAARRFVLENHSWEASFARLDAALEA